MSCSKKEGIQMAPFLICVKLPSMTIFRLVWKCFGCSCWPSKCAMVVLAIYHVTLDILYHVEDPSCWPDNPIQEWWPAISWSFWIPVFFAMIINTGRIMQGQMPRTVMKYHFGEMTKQFQLSSKFFCRFFLPVICLAFRPHFRTLKQWLL